MKHFFLGQTLIELLLAMSLTGILLPVLIVSFTSSRDGQAQETQRIGAVQLVREGQEAVRSVRERGWGEIEINGTYHPVTTSGVWSLQSGEETIDGYTREVTISDVYRDSSGTIVGIGGTIDPSTKRIEVSVSWETPRPSTLTSTMFMSRFENDVFFETTEETFLEGELDGTVVENIIDGEIILGAGGHGDWCSPNESIVADLDYPGQAEARALTAIEGRAFAGTGSNASGLPFGHIALSNANPPVASIIGTFTNISPQKTNGVFGEEDYAYITTDANSREVVVIDVTAAPYAEEGYFDPTGNNQGFSVFVSGNTGYMTTGSGNTFRTFDLSSKSGSRPQLDQVTLAGVGYTIYVRGNYAYVAVNSSSTQLQIIDVSNPSNISVVGSLQVTNVGGRDVYVNETGTRAYLVTANSAGNPEFFIIDTTAKNNPTIVSGGTYDTGAMSPTGVRVVPGNRAIVVGETGGERYQVVNISTETAPSRCGGLSINPNIYGVDAVLEEDGDAYSYIVTADANAEFKIIEGGPGGSFATDGTYTSHAIDAGEDVVFNRIIPDVTLPPSTEALFHVAVTDAVNNNCTDPIYTFVGPDGTAGTYFDHTGGPLPFENDGSGFENPARCVKYRVYLTSTDFTASPIVNSVTINYSY